MKKNWLKICLPAFVLMGMMSLTVSASMEAAASAEENGYWITKVDDAGETVRIFVYTEPVKWEIREDADLGRCNMDGSETPTPSAERIAGVGQAEAVWRRRRQSRRLSPRPVWRKRTATPSPERKACCFSLRWSVCWR